MKFADIPKFTKTSPYTVNQPLESIQRWVDDMKSDYDLQLNPDFQRGHVWTIQQQIAYVEYLLRGGTSGRNLYFNSPHWMGSFKGEMVCVDGLQRLTACLAFINNQIPIFGNYHKEFEDRLRLADITLIVNINDLKTKKEILTWYLEMNSGGTPHTDSELYRVRKLLEKEMVK